MSVQLLEKQDFAVAAWTWQAFRLHPMFINRAFGILEDGVLVGSIIFHNYNGQNVEFSYHAENVMTAGIVRAMARFVLDVFHVERVTIHIAAENLALRSHMAWFGARREARLESYYGFGKDALQYVIFKEQLIKIARVRATMH